jgi:hypothetical protein
MKPDKPGCGLLFIPVALFNILILNIIYFHCALDLLENLTVKKRASMIKSYSPVNEVPR